VTNAEDVQIDFKVPVEVIGGALKIGTPVVSGKLDVSFEIETPYGVKKWKTVCIDMGNICVDMDNKKLGEGVQLTRLWVRVDKQLNVSLEDCVLEYTPD
jgi:ribose 5-phosphate isomerase